MLAIGVNFLIIAGKTIAAISGYIRSIFNIEMMLCQDERYGK